MTAAGCGSKAGLHPHAQRGAPANLGAIYDAPGVGTTELPCPRKPPSREGGGVSYHWMPATADSANQQCDSARGIASALLHFVGPAIPGERLLDVSTWSKARAAAVEMGYQTVGVTAAASAVSRAQDDDPAAQIYCAELNRLPFRDGAFDVTVVELVDAGVDDFTATLLECYRVTTPGGVVALAISNDALLSMDTRERVMRINEAGRDRHRRRSSDTTDINTLTRLLTEVARDFGLEFAELRAMCVTEMCQDVASSAGVSSTFTDCGEQEHRRGKPSSIADAGQSRLRHPAHSSTMLLAAAVRA